MFYIQDFSYARLIKIIQLNIFSKFSDSIYITKLNILFNHIIHFKGNNIYYRFFLFIILIILY